MANVFGDQFLKAGLVSKTRLNEAKKSTQKRQKQKQKQKIEVIDEAAAAARRAAEEKAARDRELNRRQKEEATRKAVRAQVRQLIEMNRLSRDEGELGYNFQDGTVVRRIFVTEAVRDKLARGLLAIARLDSGYEVIPAVVAEKILPRDADCIVSQASPRLEEGEEDPYAEYQIPDDLMW